MMKAIGDISTPIFIAVYLEIFEDSDSDGRDSKLRKGLAFCAVFFAVKLAGAFSLQFAVHFTYRQSMQIRCAIAAMVPESGRRLSAVAR